MTLLSLLAGLLYAEQEANHEFKSDISFAWPI